MEQSMPILYDDDDDYLQNFGFITMKLANAKIDKVNTKRNGFYSNIGHVIVHWGMGLSEK